LADIESLGVVHGDIKPGNVLVSYEPEKNAMSIALADFGFSRFAATDEDLIKVTRSEPWEAPEWNHREFKLKDAKKLDIYSFGLLCVWLFFKDEGLGEWMLPLATVHTAFADKDSAAFQELQSKKHSKGFILQLAKRLVEKNERLDHEIRSRLRQVLNLILVNDPNKRASSMEELIQIFSGSQHHP
jgi:serine/threonine protein kinase